MLSHKWENLTPSELKEAIEKSGGLCIIPIGSMERHGDFLGVGANSIQAKTLADAVAEKEYAVVFPPTMWLGNSMEARAITDDMLDGPYSRRGTISLSADLMFDVLEQLCDEIRRNGFRKILLLNTYDRNSLFLSLFTRAMVYEKRDYAVMWTNAVPRDEYIFQKLYDDILKAPEKYPALSEEEMVVIRKFGESGTGGNHGDIRDTAICMSKTPEAVRPEHFKDGFSSGKADYLTSLGVSHGAAHRVNFPEYLSGYSSEGCTQNIGLALLNYCTEHLTEVVKTLKQDEFCIKITQNKTEDCFKEEN